MPPASGTIISPPLNFVQNTTCWIWTLHGLCYVTIDVRIKSYPPLHYQLAAQPLIFTRFHKSVCYHLLSASHVCYLIFVLVRL